MIALRTLPTSFGASSRAIEGALRPSGLNMTLTGAPIFFSDIQSVTERDLRRAEIISFPFAGLALLLVFGSLVAAFVPALIGGTAVVVTLGLVVLVTRLADVSIFAMSLVSMLGLGLGIDYSLFVVSRFRDELAARTCRRARRGDGDGRQGGPVLRPDRLHRAARPDDVHVQRVALARHRRFDRGGAVGAGRADAAAGDPGRRGRRIDALTGASDHAPTSGLWHAIAERVMRRAGLVFVAVMAFLVLLGAPFLHVKFGAPDASILPADVQSRQGFDQLRTAFGEGEISPILIAVTAPDSIYAPERLAALNEFVSRIRADPRVERVDSIVSLDPRLTFEQHLLIFADPSRIADPYARALAAETTRDRFTLVRVVSRAARLRTSRSRWSRRSATRRSAVTSASGSRRHGRRHRLRRRALLGVPAGAGVHRRRDVPRAACCCSARSCCRSRRWS